MRLITFLLSLLEGPSRVRLLESEVAHLRRHVGMLMRAKEAQDAEEMERRMARGLEETRAVLSGHQLGQTARLPGAKPPEAANGEGGQP